MSDVWRRLRQACERLRPHLPRGGLNPPATAAQIRAVEQLVGYRFPAELREAYQHFNGSTPLRGGVQHTDACPHLLLPYFDWADLGTLARNWAMLRQVEDRYCPEDADEPWTQPQRRGGFHDGWLPVGHSGTSAYLVVDLDPTRFGRVGQVLSLDMGAEWVAPSLNACLERLVDAFEAETLRWDFARDQWVDAAGAWVYDITAVTGPWPPLEPGGTRRRVKPRYTRLPPAAMQPTAFEDLRASMGGTLAAMLPAGQTLPTRGAHPEQVAHAEAVFGQRLPLEAAACWSVLDGAVGRHPDVWFSLRQATLAYREWQTWAALQAPLAEGPPSDDGRVRAGPWRAGWLPVGEHHRRLICLDMDPGHGGSAGQLIEIERPIDGPWAGRASAAPRRLADGLAPWLWQLATGAGLAAGFDGSPSALAWRALQGSCAQPAVVPARAWSAQGWAPDPAVQGPRPFFPRHWRVFQTLQHEHASSKVHHLGGSHHEASAALGLFNRWAKGRVPGRALVVAPIGAGTSSLLRSGFARARQAWQADASLALPVLVDAAAHAGVTSLQALLDAEAARRGASAEGMVQALADARCALIVDHVEALLPAWPAVWAACDVITGAASRVMFVCKSETFDSLRTLSQTFDVFCARQAQGRRSGWLAVHAEDSDASSLAEKRCRQLGLKVKPEVFRSPQPMGDLATRLGFFVLAAPWLVQPPAGDPNPAAMQAWWLHLAARQPHCSSDAFNALLSEALLVRWQPSAPLPLCADERLRPWLCAALGVRAPDGEVDYSSGVRAWPLVQAMARDDDDGVVSLLCRVLAEQPSDATASAAWTADWWRQLGHAQPWRGAARLLLLPQPPAVAGFLLALGHHLAQPGAVGLSMDEYRLLLRAACGVTLPQPINRACTAGADLRGQQLMDAQLSGIDLRGACLDGADLANAWLEGARLDGASMQNTRLAGATLQGVQAVKANLSGADLRNVLARGFVAESCDLRHARWNARWPDARFTDCINTDGLDPASAEAPADLG